MQYNVCPDSVNNPGHGFTLTGAYTSTTSAVASFTDSACTTDYLLVPCGTNTRGQSVNSDGSVCAMRMCGSVFNSINAQVTPAPVYSESFCLNSETLHIYIRFCIFLQINSEINSLRTTIPHKRT